MFNIFQKIRKHEILKVFSFATFSVIVKMITGFITNKVVSLTIGPSGIAIVGQFTNVSAIINNLSTGGIHTGVTKYVAENRDNGLRNQFYISTAFKIVIMVSLFFALCIIIFCRRMAEMILFSSKYWFIFVIFGVFLLFYAINYLLLSILNGYQEYSTYVLINVFGNIIGLVSTVTLTFFFKLEGVLISLAFYQSLILIITLKKIKKFFWVRKQYFFKKFDKCIAKKYLNYTLMSIVGVTLTPVSQLLLRRYIILNISADSAGWWEAINRISGIYLMIVPVFLDVYFMPKVAKNIEVKELKLELIKTLKLLLLLFGFSFICIYFLRSLLIKLLFSKEFLPMENLFKWQLINDFLKIAIYPFSYIIIAKAMTILYIVLNITIPLATLALSFIFIKYTGIIGIIQANILCQVIFLLPTILLINRKIRKVPI